MGGLTASMSLDLRDLDICVTQIDIGNAATDMTAGDRGLLSDPKLGSVFRDSVPAYPLKTARDVLTVIDRVHEDGGVTSPW